MDHGLKILNSEYLTEGLQWVELSNGEKKYLCGDYCWKDRHLPKHLYDLGIERRKAGIQSEHIYASDFLLSLKRASTIGREMIYWNIDCMPSGISKEQAIQIRRWEDSLFKDLMNPYRSDLLWNDTTIGTEVYEASHPENIDDIIKENKIKSWGQAFEIVLGVDSTAKILEPTGNVYRGTQRKQIDEIISGLSNNPFVLAETPPGGGKTPISYFVRREIKNLERVRFYVTDTINNTIQSLWKFHEYHSNDGVVMKNPVCICTGDQKDDRIIKSGARIIPASVIETNLNEKNLENLMYEIASTENEYNIFCTYYSAEAFLALIERWNINNPSLKFPIMYRDCDEVHCTSEREITHSFTAIYRYQNLFSRGIGFSGTLIRRPQGFADKNIVYNGDLNYGGPIISVVTEQEARGCGQIADQKVLIYPFPINQELRTAIKAKKDISILLGKSKITGKNIRVKEKASMLLVQNALVTVTKQFGKHHIHLPFVKRSDAKKAFIFVRRMQEAGLLSDKYKLFLGLRENGNDTLEKFKKEEFAIIFGTRWMTRGTDTENCDCQIYTYIPSAEDIAVQLKGRTHRPHASKDYSLLVIIDFEDDIRENPLYNIIEKNSKGLGYTIIGNTVSIPEIDYTKVVEEEIISTSKNHTDGNIKDTDILIMESPGSNPDLFAVWKKIVKSITCHTYSVCGISSFLELNNLYNFEEIHQIAINSPCTTVNELFKEYLPKLNDPRIPSLPYVNQMEEYKKMGPVKFMGMEGGEKIRSILFNKIDSIVNECILNKWSINYAMIEITKIASPYLPFVYHSHTIKGVRKTMVKKPNPELDKSLYGDLPEKFYVSTTIRTLMVAYKRRFGDISDKLFKYLDKNAFKKYIQSKGITRDQLRGRDEKLKDQFIRDGIPDQTTAYQIFGEDFMNEVFGPPKKLRDKEEISYLKDTIKKLYWEDLKTKSEIARDLNEGIKTIMTHIESIKKEEGIEDPIRKDPKYEKASEILIIPLKIDDMKNRGIKYMLKDGRSLNKTELAIEIGFTTSKSSSFQNMIKEFGENIK